MKKILIIGCGGHKSCVEILEKLKDKIIGLVNRDKHLNKKISIIQ